MWKQIKRFWPYLNKSCITPTDISPDESSLDTANRFNQYFSNVGTNRQQTIPIIDELLMQTAANPPVFEFHETDHITLTKAITDVSPLHTCGVDGITSRLLKAAGDSIVDPLLSIKNLPRPMENSKYHPHSQNW